MKDQYIILIDEEIAKLKALQELYTLTKDENTVLLGKRLGLIKAKEIIMTTHNEW